MDDYEMLPEYDFSNGIRGAFANRWTEEQKAQILQDAIEGTARTWHEFAAKRVRALEAALFAHTVLASPALRSRELGPSATRPFRALVRLASELEPGVLPRAELRERLSDLAAECHWAFWHGHEGTAGGPAERLAHIERLERIGREAEAVQRLVDESIQQHLARSGLSEREIERKMEETAQLWLAA
ncbi:MAG TPA: hypothetical protein VFR37_16950 [Longimicrobium sp.]|nr:hypothetical protein [Longimicrobium sp.]